MKLVRNDWFLILWTAIFLLNSACQKKDPEGYLRTENGLYYKFIITGNGQKAHPGDVMLMDIAYYNGQDSLLFDSKLLKDSFTVVLVEPSFKGGVEEGFAMMSAGDSALFKVNADSLFSITFAGQSPYHPVKDELIKFRVKLHSFITKEISDSIKVATDLRKRREEFSILDSFLIANKMDVAPTKNGAYLLIRKFGQGPYASIGDTIKVIYKGMLVNGMIFDSTADINKPLTFVFGKDAIISGWEECMPYLNKGAEAKFALPSDLGYGSEAKSKLPGYSSLIFDVRIVDIIPGKR